MRSFLNRFLNALADLLRSKPEQTASEEKNPVTALQARLAELDTELLQLQSIRRSMIQERNANGASGTQADSRQAMELERLDAHVGRLHRERERIEQVLDVHTAAAFAERTRRLAGEMPDMDEFEDSILDGLAGEEHIARLNRLTRIQNSQASPAP